MRGTSTEESASTVVVLGVGNALYADEGFGINCAQRMREHWELGGDVVVVDWSTLGHELVPYVSGARRLLLFDAADSGDAPGTLRTYRGDVVPALLSGRAASPHQLALQDVLASAAMIGPVPIAVTLIAVQPRTRGTYGAGLSPIVASRVEEAVALGIAELVDWGVTPSLRSTPSLAGARAEARGGA